MSVKEINENLRAVSRNLWEDTMDILEGAMVEGESMAKANAPWTDRTSLARNSINSTVERGDESARGYLAIGAEYGVYLELANAGKHRIILPTLFAIQAYLNDKLNNMPLRKNL